MYRSKIVIHSYLVNNSFDETSIPHPRIIGNALFCSLYKHNIASLRCLPHKEIQLVNSGKIKAL